MKLLFGDIDHNQEKEILRNLETGNSFEACDFCQSRDCKNCALHHTSHSNQELISGLYILEVEY